MTTEIDHLFKHPEHIRVVAEWIYDEFWAGRPGYSIETFDGLLRQANDPSRIPLSLVALHDGDPVGTVNLIESDSPSHPELHPWLAALVVVPKYRHHGIGTRLVRDCVNEARRLDVPELFLGTDIPGFYSRLGASIYKRVDDSLCIMRYRLADRPYRAMARVRAE